MTDATTSNDEFWGGQEHRPVTDEDMASMGFDSGEPLAGEDDVALLEAICNDPARSLDPHKRRLLAVLHDHKLATHLVEVMSEAMYRHAVKDGKVKPDEAQ